MKEKVKKQKQLVLVEDLKIPQRQYDIGDLEIAAEEYVLPAGCIVIEDNEEYFAYRTAYPLPDTAVVMPISEFRSSEIWMKDAERLYHICARYGYGQPENSFHQGLINNSELPGKEIRKVVDRWINNKWVSIAVPYMYVTSAGAEFCYGMFNDFVEVFPNIMLYPIPGENSLAFGSTFYNTSYEMDERLTVHETETTMTFKWEDKKLLTVTKTDSDGTAQAHFKVRETQFYGLKSIVTLTKAIAAAVEQVMMKWEIEP